MDTETSIPKTLPARVLIAAPNDGSPPVMLATHSQVELTNHLLRAGIDPQACAIGTADLEGADFQVEWDRHVHVDVRRR